MKVKENDYSQILSIVEDKLSLARTTYGVNFTVLNVYLYGSQLTEKERPGDIDAYVQVQGLEITDKDYFLMAYCPSVDAIKEEDLVDIIHEYLHLDQPRFQGLPIDINFSRNHFDLDGQKVKLSDF